MVGNSTGILALFLFVVNANSFLTVVVIAVIEFQRYLSAIRKPEAIQSPRWYLWLWSRCVKTRMQSK
jgi:hypothetical protein